MVSEIEAVGVNCMPICIDREDRLEASTNESERHSACAAKKIDQGRGGLADVATVVRHVLSSVISALGIRADIGVVPKALYPYTYTGHFSTQEHKILEACAGSL